AARCIEQLEVETDFGQIGKLNRLFHLSLYAKTRNKRLMRLVEEGLNEEERFLRFNLSAMGLGKLSQDDHWELLRLAEQRAVEPCVEALKLHLNRGVKAVTEYLNSNKAINAKPARASKKKPA
ncbi:FCD domain-containing protein, partial [Pseudomonas tremae]